MNEILCSTGALIGRPNGRNYRLLKDLSERLTCDGFEFMMYDTWYAEVEKMVAALREMYLWFPILHCEKNVGEKISIGGEENIKEAMDLFEINCDSAKRIGSGKIVLHLWSGMASDQKFEHNMQAYPGLKSIAEKYGQELLIENVVCNFEDPMKHFCELAMAYPKVKFVFDTKMAEFHQQMELLYAPEYEWLWKNGHIIHYHVNDYKGGYKDWSNLRTLPVGDGQIDFEKFFEFTDGTGYQGMYTVESTAFDKNGVVDAEMLNRQFAKIRSILDARSISRNFSG